MISAAVMASTTCQKLSATQRSRKKSTSRMRNASASAPNMKATGRCEGQYLATQAHRRPQTPRITG
jgi:hypothetical protein